MISVLKTAMMVSARALSNESPAADRGRDAFISQPVGVAHREVLCAPIASEYRVRSVTQASEHIGLVTFMHADLGYLDDETCRLEPIENPFGRKVLPLRSE
jgi:hypothetical protein